MRNEMKGFLYVGLSALFFSLMSLFVKICSLPSSQIVFIRSIFQTFICLLACKKQDINPFGPKKIRGLLVLRGLFGGLAVGCYFYGVRYGNLGNITAIFFTAPAMSTLLATIFLKDKLKVSTVAAILFCLLGTALVAKPEFLFHKDISTDTPLAIIVIIVGAFLSSAGYLMISVIGEKAHHLTMVFYFGIMSSLISFIPMLVFVPQIPSIKDVFVLIGVIIFAYLGQVTVNAGIQMTSNIATLMRNLDIVFAFLYSYFLFKEPLSLLSVLGAFLICFGTGLTIIDKYNNRYNNYDELPPSPLSPMSHSSSDSSLKQ